MTAVLRRCLSRWPLSLLGTVLIAVLVWFFGPLLGVLEPWAVRLAVVLVLLLAWAGANLLLDWRRRRRDAALLAGLTQAGPEDATAGAVAEETAALRERLAAALGLLRRARGTRGYLYEQPWYVIIGPPGAGKTTALLNAGLRFPLAQEMGQGALAGVGGTRLCDWWFTDDAVLIDTAGRYTTQDSDAVVDRAGWEAFLGLLRRTRPRQPLNGVIVAIAVTELAGEGAPLAHARAVRARVKELEARLGTRLPVYVTFTKADLLAGFTEFFDDLDGAGRAQVWGTTFPVEVRGAAKAGLAGAAGRFAAEFALLVERLHARLIDRLQAERSPDRRALIAGFPTQVASLAAPLTAFLEEAFAGSRLDAAPLLRGAYLTSGTQEGTPIDRLAGTLSRAFGLDQRRLPSLRPEHGRAYFLQRLVGEVILGEAMLVSEPPAARRRRRLLRGGAFAGMAVVALGVAGLVWRARMGGEAQVEGMAAALSAYEGAARGVRLDPVGDGDLRALVPLLDRARALAAGQAEGGGWQFGLSQDAKLQAGARTVYDHALDYALLPRLLWRLEAQMRGALGQPDFLYEATRVYLMLGGAGPLDRSLVRQWMSLDWGQAFPEAASAPLRAALLGHLDAMLAQPLPAVAVDGALVARARTAFSRVSLAQRVYSRIRPSAAALAVPPWLPRDALGPAGVGVFVRASGKPMDMGIPGFLTVAGFHGVLLPSLASVSRSVASESWVLGQAMRLDPDSPAARTLERDVVALYEADYVAAWGAMLADLNVVPMRSLAQAAQDLYILSSPDSPMRSLLGSVARQVTLSVPPPPPAGVAGAAAGAVGAAGAAVAGASAAVAGADGRLAALFGSARPGEPAPLPPGHEVDEQFKPLRDLVGSGAGAPLDQVLKLLNEVQQRLAKLAAAPVGASTAGGAAATGADPSLALRAEAARQPQPLARWLDTVAAGDAALRSGNARQQIVAAFNGTGGPAALCAAAINGRFPFTAGSASDVPMDDFARLFAPGGLLDGFFNTQLRPYVDMSASPWRAQSVDGVQPPVAAADLAQFQRAASIRDLFFGTATTPSLRLDVSAGTLDTTTKQAALELGGVSVVSEHGPPRPTQITWPGPSGMPMVRLTFDPPPAAGPAALQATGPWAMFRLLAQGKLQAAGSPDRYTATFRLGDREAAFDLRAGSTQNPLAPGLLGEFRCPAVQ